MEAQAKKLHLILGLLLVAFLLIFSFILWKNWDNINYALEPKEDTSKPLKLTFLDIGQGDATFIEFPDGQQMLIDCAIDSRIMESLGEVMPFYDLSLDYLVITHPDKDHYGGCIDVLERFDVENIFYTGLKKENSKFFDEFIEYVEYEDTEYFLIDKKQTWEIASTTVFFMFPDDGLKNWAGNNSSIVMKISYGDMDVLLTGDAEKEVEEHLVEEYGYDLDAEIYKVGHHGSGTSSNEDFLYYVDPDDSIVSAGLDNKYGHPSKRVLNRLEREGSKVWRTDIQGNIFVSITKSEYEIVTEKK